MTLKAVNQNKEILLQASIDGELQVHANSESELEHGAKSGRAFAWRSNDADIDIGDTLLFIKNTGDKFLILARAEFGPANVVCKYDIGVGAATTTPTGNVITAVNMNESFSTQTESYLAYDDETAVADATPMFTVAVSTVEGRTIPLDGIILGKNHYIQINQETESTSGQVTVFGHFVTQLI